MKALGINVGDVVEIEGKRKTAAIAWPAYAEDQGMDIIRMDGLIRKNANVGLGEKVIVRKADPKIATMVKLAPVSFTINVDPGFVSFVKRRLIDTPLVEGDQVVIPVLGQPSGIVKVTEDTNLTILEKPTEISRVPRVTYEDIGGLKEAIRKIREMVELPLRHPELFKRLGIDPPKGVLLYGPPGCGKTLLAKAVASQTKATFIKVVASELVQKYIGEGARLVRELFQFARMKAPSIVFIDEIDAIGGKRTDISTSGEREVHRTLLQLLSELDGFNPRGDVKIIAATNRIDLLDPALLRPGRFDRIIEVPLPNLTGREAIFKIYISKMNIKEDIKELAKELAKITEGATGADIKAICTEAGMFAIRDNREYVIKEDFLKAIEKILRKSKGKVLSSGIYA
jgi:transitional endoplasmic reticulum ATPase